MALKYADDRPYQPGDRVRVKPGPTTSWFYNRTGEVKAALRHLGGDWWLYVKLDHDPFLRIFTADELEHIPNEEAA